MTELPLDGFIVIDTTRMLPGAVLARLLGDLGARLLKVEDPAGGDPFRAAPPLENGIGAGFAALYRGAESLALDLRDPGDAAVVRKLVKHADVFVESFRPGTLERWDLGRARLRALNPGLVSCSLSSYGSAGEWASRVGHDLNFSAQSGLLPLLRGGREEPADGHLPRVQVADVASGLLACSAILAALLTRARTGIGADLDQPLALGPLPFVAWAQVDALLGGPSMTTSHLAGAAPCYRTYVCADGQAVALGAIEPKFWASLVEAAGLPELAGAGLDTGSDGADAAARLATAFAARPRDHWLDVARDRNLPLTAAHDPVAAKADGYYGAAGGAWFGAWPARAGAAPRLGEHTARVLAEFGVTDAISR
ncbi:MAG: CoA transferase [Candidatus Sericytochromatia bacterium]|nr:CoA transferase [Candidatus Tanganyikabacteria bacterium]